MYKWLQSQLLAATGCGVVEHRKALRGYEAGNGHAIRLFKHTVRSDAYVQTAKKGEFCELASMREALQRQKSRSQGAKEPHE